MRHSMKTIRLILKLTLIIFSSILIASLFGAIHNQLSYSVSKEFFTNFLFGKFEINEWNINNRLRAAFVGVLGSYLVGFYLGIFYSTIYLFVKTKKNLKNIFKAIFINVGTAFLGSLIAFFTAAFLIRPEHSGVFVDFGTGNPENYIQAAYMHIGSYYGSVIGLILGIIFLFRRQ